jgi:hypothetical protein
MKKRPDYCGRHHVDYWGVGRCPMCVDAAYRALAKLRRSVGARVWYLCITSNGVALFTERSRKRAEYLAGLEGVKLKVVKVREEK